MMSNTNSRSGINPYRRFQASPMEKIVVDGRSSSDVVTKNDCMQNFSKSAMNSDQQQQQQQQQIYSTSSSMPFPNSSVIGNSLYSSSDQSKACSLIDWPASSSNSNINKKLESPKKKKPSLRKMNLPFPWKLQKLLDDLQHEGRQDIASWSPSGRSFRVHKPDEFSRDVMGHYFRQTKYNSFTRQLYIYGFSKIENGPEVGSFHHPSFLRDVKPEALTIGRNESNQDRRCKRKTKSFDATNNYGGDSNGDGKRSLAERKSSLIDYYKNLYSSSSNTSNSTSETTLPAMATKNDSFSNVRALAPARMRAALREGAVSPVHPYGSQRNTTTTAVHPPRSSNLHLLDQRMDVQLDSIYGDHRDNSNRTSRMISTSTNGSSLLGQVPDLETGHHKHNTVTTNDDYGSSNHYYNNVAEAPARRLSLSSLHTITRPFLPQELLLDQGLTSTTSLIQDEKQQTEFNIQDNSSRRDDMMFDDDLSWLNLPSSSTRKESAVDEILFVQKNPLASFDTASNDTVVGGPREVGYDAKIMNDMLQPRTIEEMMSEQWLGIPRQQGD